MRATLLKLRERARLFATHLITQSLGVALPRDERVEARALGLVEALIDWLSFEEGHPGEWRAFVRWINELNALNDLLTQELIAVAPLLRLMLTLEGHLISLTSPGELSGVEWLAWRRRHLSACERVMSHCELRGLSQATSAPLGDGAERALLFELAFGEQVGALHGPLVAQLEARYQLRSALSAQHLFTLSSDRASWWRLSLSELCQRQGIELIQLKVRAQSGWEPLQALARQLLHLRARAGGRPSPEHALLSLWSEPLRPAGEAVAWLEELSPRSRLTWLRRAFQLILFELGRELGLRVCVWVESSEWLSCEVTEELTALFMDVAQERAAPFLLITQRSSDAPLPEAFTQLGDRHRSTLPQRSLSEVMRLTQGAASKLHEDIERAQDLATSWEALWLLSMTNQLRLDAQGRFELCLSQPAQKYRALSSLADALWESIYLQLTPSAQGALMERVWRAELSDHLWVDDAPLEAFRGWFGGVESAGVRERWAPIERSTTWPYLPQMTSLDERLASLSDPARRALRARVANSLSGSWLETGSVAELERCRVALGDAGEASRAWSRLREKLTRWWGLSRGGSPEAISCSLLDEQDQLLRASVALTSGARERAEELLAMTLSKGERGGAYWRSVRTSFGLLCWYRGDQDEATLFLDEVLARPLDERWGARMQARTSFVKGLSLTERGALREASLSLYTASRVSRAVGELSLCPLVDLELSHLALQIGERASGVTLLEGALKGSKEQRLQGLSQRASVELSLWALHYGALSRAQRSLLESSSEPLEPEGLTAQLRRFSLGLYAIHERAWGEALGALAQLSVGAERPTLSSPQRAAQVTRARRLLFLEAQLFMGLALVETDHSASTLVRVQGLARDVRLHREVSSGLALFARYLELRVASHQPLAGEVRARELRSRLYELREEWGERSAMGSLSLTEALLYALSGVEVGAALGSAMEQLTELESLKLYLSRARAELNDLGWLDTVEQRWELQRIRALLPQRGAEAPWLGASR